MTDKQKASNESPLCWVRPVTTVPDLGGFQVCREGEGIPVWAHPNGMYAPVSAEPVALPQCPFPCGWSGLHKIAVQDAAYLAKVEWLEDEEGVSVPRATVMRSMDYLIQVCRTMLNAATVASQSQQPVNGADETIPRHVAATLANAIYETAQKIGIANGDHTNLSVGQCLHLLDCMAGQLSGNPGQVDQFRDAAQMIEPSESTGELDERAEFETWVAERDGFPCAGQFLNLMWAAWQARAALAQQDAETGETVSVENQRVTQREADKVDADRYRFIRDGEQDVWCSVGDWPLSGDELDAAIDAVRKEQA